MNSKGRLSQEKGSFLTKVGKSEFGNNSSYYIVDFKLVDKVMHAEGRLEALANVHSNFGRVIHNR